MLQSMTAYGQSLHSCASLGELRWEIRSLNQRHLDISLRLPDLLRSIDAQVRETITKRVHRGKLDVTLSFTEPAESTGELVVDQRLLRQLSDAIDEVQAVRIDAGQCDVMQLLQWPGLLSASSTLHSDTTGLVIDAFHAALDDFMQARVREGRQLASLLESRAMKMSQLIADLRLHRPSVVQRQREKLLSKLSQLDIEHDPARLEQELVYSAQRLDIDEELERLEVHLKELSDILMRDEPSGRRLDFLMQELNREANTVASKSSDSETSARSIDMKVLIEQMREQVQNVE